MSARRGGSGDAPTGVNRGDMVCVLDAGEGMPKVGKVTQVSTRRTRLGAELERAVRKIQEAAEQHDELMRKLTKKQRRAE